MNKENEHLQALSDIRSMMEKSSRFISLSGLSGVFAGTFALIGAAAVYWKANRTFDMVEYYNRSDGALSSPQDFLIFMLVDAFLVLLASLIAGIVLTMRKAKQKGQSIWDATSKRLLINMLIPLAAGGFFCLILLYHGLIGLVAPATLLFYGLALLNASKYTLDDIRYLGIFQIVLGLISSLFIGYGLLFWALGFGVLHIVYGILMYNKYEK